MSANAQAPMGHTAIPACRLMVRRRARRRSPKQAWRPDGLLGSGVTSASPARQGCAPYRLPLEDDAEVEVKGELSADRVIGILVDLS